jgi:transcriptional regulator with XRE-family HTH domain
MRPEKTAASPARARHTIDAQTSAKEAPNNLRAGEVADREDTVEVGSKLRSLRKGMGLTLQQLGERVHLSASYLSLVETGKADINLSKLKALASALDVPMMELFVNGQDLDVSLVRRERQPTYRRNGRVTERLLFVKDRMQLQTTILNLPPGSDTGKADTHEGEEACYVLSGRVRIHLGDRTYDLESGDIIYYRSPIPHSWENPGAETTHALITNTPGTF